jgi:dipeptidyl aminopeptidase/acylaminoacyl peptidase
VADTQRVAPMWKARTHRHHVYRASARYDWEDRSTGERRRLMDFLERVVVKRSQSRHPDTFRKASPLSRVHADAPPLFVVHGTEDGLIPVGEARAFVEEM